MNRSKFERFAQKKGLLLERLENDKRYTSMETEWAWRGYCEKASEVPPAKEVGPHDIEDYVNGWNDYRETLLEGETVVDLVQGDTDGVAGAGPAPTDHPVKYGCVVCGWVNPFTGACPNCGCRV